MQDAVRDDKGDAVTRRRPAPTNMAYRVFQPFTRARGVVLGFFVFLYDPSRDEG